MGEGGVCLGFFPLLNLPFVLAFLLHSLVLSLQSLTEEGFKENWWKSDRDGPERGVL